MTAAAQPAEELGLLTVQTLHDPAVENLQCLGKIERANASQISSSNSHSFMLSILMPACNGKVTIVQTIPFACAYGGPPALENRRHNSPVMRQSKFPKPKILSALY
jgi:hypothetical protein